MVFRKNAGVFGIAVLVLISAVGLLFPREQILWGNGYGFDGWIYGEMAERFPQNVIDRQLSQYFACRLLPPACARGFLWLFASSPQDASVIMAFRTMNTVLMVTGTVLWVRLGRFAGLGQAGLLWGWLTLFGSFFTGRILAYYPVLTDGWAIFWGLLLLHFSLGKNLCGLVMVSLAASFTWPHAIWFGAFLVLVVAMPPGVPGRSDWLRFPVKCWFVGLFFVVTFVGLSFLRYGFSPEVRVVGLRLGSVRLIAQQMLILAIWCFGVGVMLAEYRPLQFFTPSIFRRSVVYCLAAGAMVIVHRLILAEIANPELPPPEYLASIWVVMGMGAGGDGQVLTAPVNHLYSAGPLVAFGAANWRIVCREAVGMGHGVVLGCLCVATAWIQPESRFVMLLLPFGVLAVCKSIEGLSRSWLANALFLPAALYFSGVWRTINPPAAVPGEYRVIEASLPDLWNAAASGFLSINAHGGGYEWDNFFWRAAAAMVVYTSVFALFGKLAKTAGGESKSALRSPV